MKTDATSNQEAPAVPQRRRPRQQPLVTKDGDTLKNHDKDGNPIEKGVVNEEVRQAAEDYSAAMYAYGQAKAEKDNAEEKLKDAMHDAGVSECVARDHEGLLYRYVIKEAETVKRKKLKDDEAAQIEDDI